MEIIKSIRTWKPVGRKKSKDKLTSAKPDGAASSVDTCGPVLLHQGSIL
jgi:hypothetical protein